MNNDVKLVIPASKSVEDGILSIIDYVKEKERASGKLVKEVVANYILERSYSLATLIKNYYKDEVKFAIFSAEDANTHKHIEHACVVFKNNDLDSYFDINGKKSLDQMKRYIAKMANTTIKNVDVKDGYFFAITNVTNQMFKEIARNHGKEKQVAHPSSAKKAATTTKTAKSTKTATKSSAKTSAKKVSTKTASKTTKKPAAKTTKKTATKKTTTKKTATKTKTSKK